jgi:ribonucleoside-diphosphate reductase alpha chain
MDTFATTVSVALQYGVPLRDLVNKFAHVRFEPSGFTGNQEIPIAKSIVDYIFRWLGSRFLSPEDKANLGLIDRSALVTEPPTATPPASAGSTSFASDAGSAGTPSGSAHEPLRPTGSPTADTTTKTEGDQPKGSAVGLEISEKGAEAAPGDALTSGAARVSSSPSPATASSLAVVATNGHANGHASNGNGNGNGGTAKAITLTLGSTNVAFKIQEDAPSCAECGSIMVRNGSCYKCLNCGSTSGCS